MLILQRKKNQSITIDGNIKVTILDIGNDRIKLAVDAPRSVSIARSELLEAADMNKEAASLSKTSLSELKHAFNILSAGKQEEQEEL